MKSSEIVMMYFGLETALIMTVCAETNTDEPSPPWSVVLENAFLKLTTIRETRISRYSTFRQICSISAMTLKLRKVKFWSLWLGGGRP